MHLSVAVQTCRKQENAGSCIIVQIAKTTGFQFTGLLKIQNFNDFSGLNLTESCAPPLSDTVGHGNKLKVNSKYGFCDFYLFLSQSFAN